MSPVEQHRVTLGFSDPLSASEISEQGALHFPFALDNSPPPNDVTSPA